MSITLYYMPQTRSLRPRWMLEELQLPYQLKPIDLFAGEGQTAEYRRINPLGRVPALDIDGHIMLESCAMCHWLADRHLERGFAPRLEHPTRARYEEWMYYVPATLEPPAWQIILHTRILPVQQRIDAIIPFARQQYQLALEHLAATLQQRDYLIDNAFTTADLLVASQILALPKELDNFPILQSYAQRMSERPAFQRAIAA